jgi:hypothetical protein
MPLVANGDDQGGATAAAGRRGACGRRSPWRSNHVIETKTHSVWYGMPSIISESFMYGSMSCEGRAVYVQASLVYHLLALDLDPCIFRAVDKMRRGFLWLGDDDAKGDCCQVAWRLVCQPKSLGGLGLLDLRRMNTALRSRWIWFQKRRQPSHRLAWTCRLFGLLGPLQCICGDLRGQR